MYDTGRVVRYILYVQCTRVVSQRIAVDIVPQMGPSDSDSLHSTTSAFRNLLFLRFELIGSLQYYISPTAKWRLRHNETVIPVFEQVKPVVIAAVTLICLILNLVNHKSKIKYQVCIILLESGHHPYLRMAILK